MTPRLLRTLLPLTFVLLSALVVLLGTPDRARACVYGGCEGMGTAIGVAALTALALDVVVLGANLEAATHGRWVDHGWATANLLMSLVNLAGAVSFFALATSDADFVGPGLALASVGALMATVGIASFVAHEQEPRLPRIHHIRMSFAPAPGGGAVVLSGQL
jgi:peptidoglycan/LPS O-acetylase OafA/YrhL